MVHYWEQCTWAGGHALSTPFGALKPGGEIEPGVDLGEGHALSTPFGALKPRQRA